MARSRAEWLVVRRNDQNESLTDQIEVLLGIKVRTFPPTHVNPRRSLLISHLFAVAQRRHEEEELEPPDLQHEGKRAPTDPLLLSTRKQQLNVIGDYCADLRERCAILTDAQSEAKERLRNAKRREMSLATELEHQTMAAMHSMHGNTEEEQATAESLRTEVDRLREELATKRSTEHARTEACSNCESLQQAVGSLQTQLDAALEETKASRLRERTMSLDMATLVQQTSTSAPAQAETDVQAQVDETVKKVLAESYDQMREVFVPANGSFSEDQCAHILAAIKGVIRGVLQSMAPHLNTPTPR